jgi:hypothetical protein
MEGANAHYGPGLPAMKSAAMQLPYGSRRTGSLGPGGTTPGRWWDSGRALPGKTGRVPLPGVPAFCGPVRAIGRDSRAPQAPDDRLFFREG